MVLNFDYFFSTVQIFKFLFCIVSVAANNAGPKPFELGQQLPLISSIFLCDPVLP